MGNPNSTLQKTAVIVVADTHINSTVGLCPPFVRQDDGGKYIPSPSQKWLWRCWLDFWEGVKRDAGDYRKLLVINGDLAELDCKRRSVQLITPNKSVILDSVHEVLTPAVYDALYIVRGTPSHVGKSSWSEETIGRELGAVQSPDGKYAWWQLPLDVDGVKFDIQHYAPMGRGMQASVNAATKLAMTAFEKYLVKLRIAPPDVVIRSHNHTHARSTVNGLHAEFSPAWTFATEYAIQKGFVSGLSDIGGLVYYCEGGRFLPEFKRYEWAKERSVWVKA